MRKSGRKNEVCRIVENCGEVEDKEKEEEEGERGETK